jgi:hypothetical protein
VFDGEEIEGLKLLSNELKEKLKKLQEKDIEMREDIVLLQETTFENSLDEGEISKAKSIFSSRLDDALERINDKETQIATLQADNKAHENSLLNLGSQAERDKEELRKMYTSLEKALNAEKLVVTDLKDKLDEFKRQGRQAPAFDSTLEFFLRLVFKNEPQVDFEDLNLKIVAIKNFFRDNKDLDRIHKISNIVKRTLNIVLSFRSSITHNHGGTIPLPITSFDNCFMEYDTYISNRALLYHKEKIILFQEESEAGFLLK